MPKFVVIDMETTYPFGQVALGSLESKEVYVRKTLTYKTRGEYQRIKEVISSYQSMKHKNLVNLDHYF